MNKLSLLGSCQQVVIKSHVKKPNLTIVSKCARKIIRLLTVPFTLVLYSQRNAFVFSNAAAPFKRSSPSMLSIFTKYIPAFYGDMSLQKIHRYGSYLFVLTCGRFRNHRALPPLPSEKRVAPRGGLTAEYPSTYLHVIE